MAPDPLLQLGRVGSDPPEQGRMIDRDAAIGRHQGKVMVADRKG
jgi:hypothetical protein